MVKDVNNWLDSLPDEQKPSELSVDLNIDKLERIAMAPNGRKVVTNVGLIDVSVTYQVRY